MISLCLLGAAALGLGIAVILYRRQRAAGAGASDEVPSVKLLQRRRTDRYIFGGEGDANSEGGAEQGERTSEQRRASEQRRGSEQRRASWQRADGLVSRPLHTVSIDVGDVELAEQPAAAAARRASGGRAPRGRRVSQRTADLGAAAGVDPTALERPEDVAAANLLAMISRKAQAAASTTAVEEEELEEKDEKKVELQAAQGGSKEEAEEAAAAELLPTLAVNQVVYYKHRQYGWLLVKVLRIDHEGAFDGGVTYVVGGAPQLNGADIETTRERLSVDMP